MNIIGDPCQDFGVSNPRSLKLLGPNPVVMNHSCESLVAGARLLGTKSGGDRQNEMDLDAMMEVD